MHVIGCTFNFGKVTPPVQCSFTVSVYLFLKMRGYFKTLIEIGMLLIERNRRNPGHISCPVTESFIFKENTCLGIDIIFVGSKDDWCTSRIHRLWSGRIFNKEVERVPQCCSAAWRGQRELSFTFLAFLIRNSMIQLSGIWQKYCEWYLAYSFTSWLTGFRPGFFQLASQRLWLL